MALPKSVAQKEHDKFVEDASGDVAVRTLLSTGDIEIGAVEIKDATSSTRAVVDSDGLAVKDGITNSKLKFKNYEYMGKKTSGSYTYFGFKEYTAANWKIMRKDGNDAGAWAYAYGTTGWTSAWATPNGESYGDPPDS